MLCYDSFRTDSRGEPTQKTIIQLIKHTHTHADFPHACSDKRARLHIRTDSRQQYGNVVKHPSCVRDRMRLCRIMCVCVYVYKTDRVTGGDMAANIAFLTRPRSGANLAMQTHTHTHTAGGAIRRRLREVRALSHRSETCATDEYAAQYVCAIVSHCGGGLAASLQA